MMLVLFSLFYVFDAERVGVGWAALGFLRGFIFSLFSYKNI